MTICYSTGKIRLQGLKKDVYKVESRVKEILYKIKDELVEQQQALMLAQLVNITLGENCALTANQSVDYRATTLFTIVLYSAKV